ncbi:MAG: HEAT repeat domain-containing protein, partial [Methanoregula sp.]|nr:HEAT repeat domain-containing protein [Methanoregula sp.]
ISRLPTYHEMEFIPRFFRQKRLLYLMVPIVVELAFFDRFNPAGLLGADVKKLKSRWDIAGLVRLLEHKDPLVQYEAAEALGDLGDEKAVAPLITALKRDEFSGVRWKAAEALSKIGNPAVGPLIRALQYPDDDVRWKAAIALGEIGNPEAVEPLIQLLSDEDRFVRSRAAHALSMIGEPAVPSLVQALKKGDYGVRWGAALALGKIKNPLAIEPLIFALADEQAMVRGEAAAALASIGTPALAPLLGFLKGAHGKTRIEVMTALGELRNADAIEPLVQLLENADDDERKAIADALDAILIPAVEPLVRRIRDGSAKNECKDPKKR